eukprot:8800776-Heterocapsa_arctica.AAC.1
MEPSHQVERGEACLLSTRSEQRGQELLACDPVREAERDGDALLRQLLGDRAAEGQREVLRLVGGGADIYVEMVEE